MSTPEIRLATAADIPDLIALERASPEAPHWPETEYRGRLSPSEEEMQRCLLVAIVDGRVVGFAAARAVGDEAELESIAVDQAVRRQGIGRALAVEVLAWSRQAGARTVLLEVRAASEGAQRLYREVGFATAGRRAGYYSAPGDDAIVMCLNLGAEAHTGTADASG